VWSDGTPFTSADVLFTWSLGANPNQSYNANYWVNVVGVVDWQKGPDFTKPIPGITAPDDLTVVFQLIEPNAAFEATLLNFRNYMLPSKVLLAAVPNIHELDNKGIWALPYWQAPTVGIGPYLWEKTETGQFLQFKPNPQQNWRTVTPPAFSQVIIKPIQDFAVSAAQVQSGDLDFAVVALNDLSGLEAAGLKSATAVAPFPIQTDFNNSKASRFQDVKVRQAFMYGCDRRGFVDSFLQGKGKASDTYFFPDWVPKDGIVEYNFDLAKAKSLLDEAKFDYSKPVVWLSWNKDARDRQSFIEDCQAKMKTIGVNIELINGLDVTNAKTAAGQWDLALYGGYPIVDPDTIRTFTACDAIGKTPGKDDANYKGSLFHWGGANYSNYCNPKFDDLMNQASKIADQAQRAALYKQAQDIYLADVPLMVTYRNATAYAWQPTLQGVVPYGDPSQIFLKIDQWSKTSSRPDPSRRRGGVSGDRQPAVRHPLPNLRAT
jgi:ABC-type transport system substrate-binding protein